MKRLFPIYIVLVLAMSTLVSGCGIKPDHVAPPGDAKDSGFPHTYPDLNLDPPAPSPLP